MPPFEAFDPDKAEQEAEIARQRTAGEPMNITPHQDGHQPIEHVKMHSVGGAHHEQGAQPPADLGGHPIDHAARHAKGRW
jgi:hypothetical protein